MTEPEAADSPAPDRIVTVPNALSVLRLALIPVFVWLLLVEKADGWAFAVLVFSGVSDWADGKLARLLDQSSRIGALLDPAADRLYIVIIPVAFGIREFLPWWLIGVIIARDVLLFASAPLLRSRGVLALPVLYIGKAGTFALMSAFPWLLAGQLDSVVGTIAYPVGWAFMIWGVGLYLWSFVLYWYQTILVVQRMPPRRRAGTSADSRV
ncbi:CDP-alcohol phosphatidyltransferase family protein [Gordonia sp. zg691]|uniref:CDP-alcohol phosphatidyltransferase family protein n=1 Tax=Gordonia jinghuaiqii TaxID=2758710 RepID=A0A7D7RML7_9ACTN|nr:CDP-alcohol phosphatidyltransferase family protein [Gordonia jinghuaiqii]MBD0862699.1 CDP-alcohol phosphatidyltransferase family protein [Gordonia jinghuaiqii]MCR5976781.1 CDP-diacylglycerol--glycerol-3-phosphate 3-phosphatidyltransferase [Gordonia jinghuaiqii]QMS99952.1 CDP-alcohol phosphatidyltransferase family protein [Gordonia jinghuaiqii]